MPNKYLAISIGCNILQFCIYQHTLQANVNLQANVKILEKYFKNCQNELEIADRELVYDLQKQQKTGEYFDVNYHSILYHHFFNF